MGYPQNGLLSGVFGFYKKDECVADLIFEKGKFTRIFSVYKKSLFPPFFTSSYVFDEDAYNRQFIQFFSMRILSSKNPYYHVAKTMEYARYISLLDDYWIKVDELEYGKLHEYRFSEDKFANRVLLQSQIDGYSPNLSLPSETLTFVDIRGENRILLQEYSKELANTKKRLGVRYTIEIIHDVPFLCVALQQKGNYFPLESVVPKALTDEQLLETLKSRNISVETEGFDRKNAYIYMINDASGVLRYL